MLDMEFTLQIYEDTRPLRIGFIVSEGHHIPLPPCQRAVEEAKSILKNQGHTVSHLSLSLIWWVAWCSYDISLASEYCKSLIYSGSNKIAIIALCPYALLWNPHLYQILNWTCCCCSGSLLYLDHAIQGSTVTTLYYVHALFQGFTVYQTLVWTMQLLPHNSLTRR